MIRSIRYITLLVLLQFVTGISVLYAQSITSASGIVRDSVSGEPLSYVSVMFENSTIGAMTDDDGAFSLQNDKGLTRLVVSSLGYDNKVVNLKAAAACLLRHVQQLCLHALADQLVQALAENIRAPQLTGVGLKVCQQAFDKLLPLLLTADGG